MRSRAFRRHKAYAKMWRRLKEDRNQHYNDLSCPCWNDGKAMAVFKEQPKRCSCDGCRNQRRNEWATKLDRLTMQERRHLPLREDDMV